MSRDWDNSAAVDATKVAVEDRLTTPRRGADEPLTALPGLLADYFVDRDDVARFIDDERSAWDESGTGVDELEERDL